MARKMVGSRLRSPWRWMLAGVVLVLYVQIGYLAVLIAIYDPTFCLGVGVDVWRSKPEDPLASASQSVGFDACVMTAPTVAEV